MKDPMLGDSVVTDNLDIGTVIDVDYKNSYVTVSFNNTSIGTLKKLRFSEVSVLGRDNNWFSKNRSKVSCECGAKFTSNKTFHLSYCPLAKK
jgi:hypothetical protein